MSQVKCKFEIKATGAYLPPRKVTAEEIAKKANVSLEWLLKSAGVETRYFADDETIASMAAKAITNAMEKTDLKYEDIDLLIAAGGTPDQPIPHNSALIHHELNLPKNIVPYDIHATCLSFPQALLVAASFLHSGIYRNIIIVSSEKPSIGLNYAWAESAALFGDGAVAFVLSQTDKEKGWIFSEYETYSEAVHLAEIPAGGTRFHPIQDTDNQMDKYLFKMEGQKIYKAASLYMPAFYASVLAKHRLDHDNLKMIVPHQASVLALNLMRNKLEIPQDKFHINVHKYGNLVGASIPMSIHELLENKTLVEGDRALLLSTAAGLTLGATVLKF
jgi:3-oxoacyl-[acyl-carrier-protein] synthase III